MMATFEDKDLQCADCGQSFLWAAGEQRFYAEKEFTPPKRCRDCRIAKKEARESGLMRQQQGEYD